METKVITFSERQLKAEQAGTARTLRDPAFPLRFRFHQRRTAGSWYVVRRNRWHLLGYWPVLTVKAVQKVLPDKLAQLAVSDGPLALDDMETAADVLTWYQDRIEKDAHRSRERKATIKSAIKCHLLPNLGPLALPALSRQALDDALIWPLQASHSLATVKAVLSVAKQAFKKAEKVGRIASNPLAGVVFSDFIDVAIQEKEGRLLATDIDTLFTRLAGCDRVTRCLVVMMLCHGTRISETLAAKWSHIDTVEGYWRIPAIDTKTGEWHQLPLTPQIVAFLSAYRTEQQRKGYRGVFLFPGHGHAKPLSYSSARKGIQRVSDGCWSAHDCRKALKTICTDLLIDDAVTEYILNHKISGVRKSYNFSQFKAPMRHALTRFHDWLDAHGFDRLHDKTETRSSRSFNHGDINHQAA